MFQWDIPKVMAELPQNSENKIKQKKTTKQRVSKIQKGEHLHITTEKPGDRDRVVQDGPEEGRALSSAPKAT